MSESEGKIAIPMGFAAKIAENADALRAFGQMSATEQGTFIRKAKGARSPEEMKAIVSDIARMR